MPKTVTVSTAKQLLTAARQSKAGDTILLAPGNYGDVVLYAVNPGGTVTIKPASGRNDVVFGSISINASSNLIVQNVDVVHPLKAGEPEWARAATIGGSHDISLVGVNFMGSMNGNRNDDGNGLVITDSSRLSILNSTFQQFNNAAVIARTDDIVFAGNTIKDVREGVNMSQLHGALFERNSVSNVVPDVSKGDHSDAFQLHAGGAAGVSSDVVFRSNVMQTDSQGIFINNIKSTQGLFQSNIVIENNFYQGNSTNGIAVYGAKNVVVTGNTVREGDGPGWSPGIILGSSENVAITRNISSRLLSRTDAASTNVTLADNIDIMDRLTGKGVAAASVFAAPLATGNIDFASLNPSGSQAVNVANIGFRATAGIGHLAGSSDALVASYVPQFDTHFSAAYFH